MKSEDKKPARYTLEQIQTVRRELNRVTGGLFALREEQQDDGTFTAVVLCYEGRSQADSHNDVDFRPAGVLAQDALDRLMEWDDRVVKPGKLGCIEDPEEDGPLYTAEALWLLQEIVVGTWDSGPDSMDGLEWMVLAGRR
jgi:hypothetical protein